MGMFLVNIIDCFHLVGFAASYVVWRKVSQLFTVL